MVYSLRNYLDRRRAMPVYTQKKRTEGESEMEDADERSIGDAKWQN